MPRGRPAAALALVEAEAHAIPASTPERARLAEAFAAVAAVEAEIAKTPSLIETAEDAHHAAFKVLQDAERTLAYTQRLASSTFTPAPRPPASFWSQEAADAYLAEQNTPPMPIDEARAAVVAATEAKQSTGATVNFHRARAERLGEELRSARAAVQDARRRVIKASPELAALAVETKRLATRLASATLALQSATGNAHIPPDSPLYHVDQPSKYTDDPASWALSRAWHAALDQLETDPSTALPMPESAP